MIFKSDPGSEFFSDERCFITEILNTDAIQDVSIARARVEPGVTAELHRLSVDEVYYILEGSGIVEIDNSFRGKVAKGDVVHIRSGLAQRITNISDSDLLFLCICSPKFKPETYTSLEQNREE